ncbi:MAG: HIT domain-containing protein [Actinobacteria bacterium]|nr:HIT domain-containing protein [Actinomycetota bacterium]
MAETAPAGCIFCGIVNGELRSEKVYEDEEVLAFRDINPKAPVHVLVIPKKHIPSLREVTAAHERLLGLLRSWTGVFHPRDPIGFRRVHDVHAGDEVLAGQP